ncbi:MAG: M23 family metallopeptidase [Eubacterium sp.]|nr:M23 family metallopeptidase [Eubacterium sp.]MBR4241208.1 M23 family metallopeptidase [Eubacterium sp.]
MSSTKNKRENKNFKALFSALCLCIIALGLIVYFSTNNSAKPKNNAVNEATTLEVTTEVQRAVTVTETTTKKQTTKAQEKTTEKEKTEPATMPLEKNNTPYKSYYKYPLSEAVINGYSEELVYNKTMGDFRAHPAVDFKGNEGDEVVAINDGLVLDVYKDNLYSFTVVIDHGGKLVAKYCGLKSVGVKKGSYVDIGNAIGTLGASPAEGELETHLHFETTLEGKSVNPLDVMGKTE